MIQWQLSEQTFKKWAAFCQVRGIDKELNPDTLLEPALGHYNVVCANMKKYKLLKLCKRVLHSEQ